MRAGHTATAHVHNTWLTVREREQSLSRHIESLTTRNHTQPQAKHKHKYKPVGVAVPIIVADEVLASRLRINLLLQWLIDTLQQLVRVIRGDADDATETLLNAAGRHAHHDVQRCADAAGRGRHCQRISFVRSCATPQRAEKNQGSASKQTAGECDGTRERKKKKKDKNKEKTKPTKQQKRTRRRRSEATEKDNEAVQNRQPPEAGRQKPEVQL